MDPWISLAILLEVSVLAYVSYRFRSTGDKLLPSYLAVSSSLMILSLLFVAVWSNADLLPKLDLGPMIVFSVCNAVISITILVVMFRAWTIQEHKNNHPTVSH